MADQIEYLNTRAIPSGATTQAIETDWHAWLAALFPDDRAPLGDHHAALWDWLWAMRPNVSPDPFVAVWSRGGAKSTNVERGVVAVGALRKRPYVLYVCGTQEQADDHVQNIATILNSARLAQHYPQLASPALNRFGNTRGWRRNRLMTAARFTVDALGLDTAARGIKVDDDRPGLIVIDDIDGEFDSAAVTDKKVALLSKKILPAGAPDLAVIAVQNLIGPDTVFARLARYPGAAPIDMLHNRVVSGPHPALTDFEAEERPEGGYRIVSGTPTWTGQDVAVCQAYIDTFGLSSFLSECQHDVDAPAGGMFDHLTYRYCEWDELPRLVRTVVWVDPAVTSTDNSDCQGIQADALGVDGKVYRLYSWEGRTTPKDALKRAITKAVELRAEAVGVETDQGGDTWQSVFGEAVRDLVSEGAITTAQARTVAFRSDKAGAGHGPKIHRAQQMLFAYERGQFVHVRGTHGTLERSLRRFPKTKPFDLTDAAYWSWWDVRRGIGATAVAGGERKSAPVVLGQIR